MIETKIYVCNDPVYRLSETKRVRFMYMSVLLKRTGLYILKVNSDIDSIYD